MYAKICNFLDTDEYIETFETNLNKGKLKEMNSSSLSMKLLSISYLS